MVARSARRREQLALGAELRAHGVGWAGIAAMLRDRYGLNARVAMRLAHGWGQADAAEAWNRRWPHEPRTFKNFSYWETWPASTGHAPSLLVLGRLAELYECDAADLIADWATHRDQDAAASAPVAEPGAEPETLAWQVDNLALPQLTRALDDWSDRLPSAQRRSLLLKLSTAAALAAASSTDSPVRSPADHPGRLHLVAGYWDSTYGYHSDSRNTDLIGQHEIELTVDNGRLVGRSDPQASGSELELSLSVDGTLATGFWSERTSPSDHYRAATYHGVLQLVVDPTDRVMSGQWLGVGKRFTIKSGPWQLTWRAR